MRKCRIMNLPKAIFSCLLVATLLSILSIQGCGGSFLEFMNQGDMSGTWNLSLTQSNVTVRQTQLFIAQEKRFAPFSGTTSDNATLTGSLNGDNVVITLNNADGSATTVTGTVSNSWNTFSGAYTSTGSNGSGAWSAARVPAPTPTPAPLSVSPSSANLSCSAGQSQTFTVAGGTRASYSVVATSNGNLVTLSTSTLTTNGQFTVTPVGCIATNGTIVNLSVTDKVTTLNLPVTISNP